MSIEHEASKTFDGYWRWLSSPKQSCLINIFWNKCQWALYWWKKPINEDASVHWLQRTPRTRELMRLVYWQNPILQIQDFKNTSKPNHHSPNQMKTTNYLSGDKTFESGFLSTNRDACKMPSTPSNVTTLSFPFASLVLEKHHQEKERTG